MAYVDYEDDGEIFNGSVNFNAYLGATLIGAGLGGLTAIALPSIGAFMGSSFTLGGQMVMTSSGMMMIGGITITGAQVINGVAATGIVVSMARIGKSNGYKIDHHYPDDHYPTHIHISGDDGKTKIDLNGNPLKGGRPMTPGERKAFKNLYKDIIKALKRWL